MTFSYAQPWLSKVLIGTGPKLIFTDMIRIPYWQGAIALAAVIAVVLYFMEAARPWRQDLGSDLDGNFPASAKPSKRLAPAK